MAAILGRHPLANRFSKVYIEPMSKSWIGVAVMLTVAAVAGAQFVTGPRGHQPDTASGWLYEGAHWLNEGNANDALFRASDSLYGVNDTLFTIFTGRRAHDRGWRYQYGWGPEPMYPQTFVYPVAPVVGPTATLRLVTDVSFGDQLLVELRVHLNGVEQTLTLAPEMELAEAPVGGFRYGLHMVVRRLGTGEVVQILSGVGVLKLEPDRHTIELTRVGETLYLK